MNKEIARLKADEKRAGLELHKALCELSDAYQRQDYEAVGPLQDAVDELRNAHNWSMLKIVLYVPSRG